MSQKVNQTLLIDDSDIDLFIQRRFLEHHDFSHDVVSFTSAGEALRVLENHCETPAPDIIFLDLNMPGIDGFEFLRSFEHLPDPVVNKSKIVVLTSSNSSKDREVVMENKNVIHFITKPLKDSDISELRRIIAE